MKFLKIHSLGNSFIILEKEWLTESEKKNLSSLAKKLCDKNTGIGADGVLIVAPSDKADIKMRIINADGGEAEMCGNGVRCFAKYVFEKGIVKKEKLKIETLAGIIEPELILEDGKIISIKTNMGKPIFSENKITNKPIEVNGKTFNITSLTLGVPHVIIFTNNLNEEEIKKIGPAIENHKLFPNKTNVNFVKIINQNEIEIKTWERGVGLSKACGTGACASVVACNLNNKTEKKVTAHLDLGDLFIEWNEDNTVYMTGPAGENISEGEIDT